MNHYLNFLKIPPTIIALVLPLIVLYAYSCSIRNSNKSSIVARRNQTFIIELPSNLGDGHQWTLLDTSLIRVITHTAKSNPDTSQSADLEQFELIASKKGIYSLTFYYLRPFDKILDTGGAKKSNKLITIK